MAKIIWIVLVKTKTDGNFVFSYFDRDQAYSNAEAWGECAKVFEVRLDWEKGRQKWLKQPELLNSAKDDQTFTGLTRAY